VSSLGLKFWTWRVWTGWPGKKPAVFWGQMSYLLGLGVFVILYRAGTIDPRRDFFGPIPFLVPWFGAVGAVMLSLTGVFSHRDDWDTKYGYWHWSRPFVGGVLATVGVLMFQSGILAVGGQLPNSAQTGGAKNLLYYLIAFVVGFREDVFRRLIQRVADLIISPDPQAGGEPVIASISPAQAQSGQQTDVVIAGSSFTGATSVKLGGKSIPFIGQSDTQISASIPNTALKGPSTLVVTTSRGAVSRPFEIT
jgi:hypothetical protein